MILGTAPPVSLNSIRLRDSINIEEVSKRVPGAKIVPGSFTSDQTTVILPKGRSAAAQAKVIEIVDQAKKAGLVRKALDQTGVNGVRAAP